VGWVFIVSRVLAIDTSTSRTSVAIIEDASILFSGFRDGATAHGPSLPELVQEALAISDVDQVVVGMGPGPFTGLRVGIAFAQSFAFARDIPVRGVCSLDAIAAQINEEDFIVAVDARRKEVYWARYTDGARVGEPAVNFPADVSGAPIHADLFPDMKALVDLPGNINEPIYLRRPDAVATADRP
jgi:tRNA threonylcarbamoyl adenosine modification protein YeaZ